LVLSRRISRQEMTRKFPPPQAGSKKFRPISTLANEIDLSARGIDETQAADLRARLKTFAEDWDRPEADIYDENPPR
jgi:hypothetical protein